ncbi:hypothetical protein GGH98_006143, partial [Coemansia sp. RSA 454]
SRSIGSKTLDIGIREWGTAQPSRRWQFGACARQTQTTCNGRCATEGTARSTTSTSIRRSSWPRCPTSS